MRIAIFGGTFDPVHEEHIRLALSAADELCADELIVVPTYSTPNKGGPAASASDRFNMLELAFKGYDKVKISDAEIKNGGTSFTYVTVERLKKERPYDQLFFLVGGDMLKDFKTWKCPERILSAARLAVFKREGDDADYSEEEEYFKNRFNASFIKLSLTGKIISSTEIRIYLSLGLSPEGVPNSVLNYIDEHKVYKKSEYAEFLKNNLTEKRLIHTANVAACALKKAKELSLDKIDVLTAALLHDCAKYLRPEDFPGFTMPEGVPDQVVHQYLGAYVAEKVLGVKNAEIIDAIRFHTSGRADMTTLGKLIFVADMVEKGRSYEGVEILRELYEKDFDLCFKTCLKEEVLHLKNKKIEIYGETLNAFNFYVKD